MSGRILARTQFGNPILQTPARRLTVKEIKSPEIQELIGNIRYTLKNKKLGVGLAAPQVGELVAISVIDFKPTVSRPGVGTFSQVIINPEVVEGIGKKESMWEGCLSFGAANSPVFAKTMRYKKIQARFHDEQGVLHEEALSGFAAHVFQHEADHLSGILFPSRVEDHTTWMNASEYKKRVVAKRSKNT
jgi:peptide deformylase